MCPITVKVFEEGAWLTAALTWDELQDRLRRGRTRPALDCLGAVPVDDIDSIAEMSMLTPVYLHDWDAEPVLQQRQPAAAKAEDLEAKDLEAEEVDEDIDQIAAEEATKSRDQLLTECRQICPPGECDAVAEACAWSELTPVQLKALAYIRRNAAILSRRSRDEFFAANPTAAKFLDWVRRDADITININLASNIASLRKHGEYLSGFSVAREQSYLKSRALWERKMFGNAYGIAWKFGEHDRVCEATERPKYGAINIDRNPSGAAPSYGFSFLVLKKHVRNRITTTAADSSSKSIADIGMLDHFCAVGQQIDPARIASAADSVEGLASRYHYIEVQIHGRVLMSRDIEAAHLSARDDVPEVLAAMAEWGIPVFRIQRKLGGQFPPELSTPRGKK